MDELNEEGGEHEVPQAAHPLCYAALCEGRHRQFSDTSLYSDTMTYLGFYKPRAVILPDLSEGSVVVNLIRTKCDNTEVRTVARSLFDLERGFDIMSSLSMESLHYFDSSSYTLGCASGNAVVLFFEKIQNTKILAKTLKVKFNSSAGTLLMDINTLSRLELLCDVNGDVSKGLFGELNTTLTVGGERLLRESLRQPPATLQTIQMRQRIVKHLVENDVLYLSLSDHMKGMPDLDQIVSQIMRSTPSSSWISARAKLYRVISLFGALKKLPDILQSLELSDLPDFDEAKRILKSSKIDALVTKIENVIDASLLTSRKPTTPQAITSIKAGISTKLDVARHVYAETLKDADALTYTIGETYLLRNLQLKYVASLKNYVFQLPAEAKTPPFLVKQKSSGKVAYYTTPELRSLSRKILNSQNEILVYADAVISALILEDIKGNLPYLYKVSYFVSLLDLLQALASYAKRNAGMSTSRYLVTYRASIVDLLFLALPELTKDGPLALHLARHPILDLKLGSSFIPNDYYSTPTESFTILTGPNMSGKTTYLKQVCLIQILAQIGSFVPADFASLRVADRIFARFGSLDLISTASSSFMLEMQEMSYIINRVTPQSLVVIDELGRSTSSVSSIPICFSICEYFIDIPCFTFFATHFIEMAQDLDAMYPFVRAHHFNVEVVKVDVKNELRYTYSLQRGILDSDLTYGIETAAAVGMSSEVILEARRLRKILDAREESKKRKKIKRAGSVDYIAERVEMILKSDLTPEARELYLMDLKAQFDHAVALEAELENDPMEEAPIE